MPVPPIRVGVSIGEPDRGESWARTARHIESCGFHSLWVADHLVAGLYAPFTALAWAAAATEHLVVGPLVLANDFRHPVIVAREAATLAELSGGRFVLGLGAGHMKVEYDEAGIAYDDDGLPVDRFVEAVEVIDALRSASPVDYQGAHYRVSGHTMYPASGAGHQDAAEMAARRTAPLSPRPARSLRRDPRAVRASRRACSQGVARPCPLQSDPPVDEHLA
jgi:alkanesulfonate monooxygenase SsuD/methylene tetrahydromethanopterin reductase-like flavin-dependent oxidoreductase (luciferase family)